MERAMTPAIAQLNRLQAQLEAAVAAGDWGRVALCDRTVSELLTQYRTRPVLLEPALAALRQSHRQALAAAQAECARLVGQLDHLTNHRDALLAYGQSLSEDT